MTSQRLFIQVADVPTTSVSMIQLVPNQELPWCDPVIQIQVQPPDPGDRSWKKNMEWIGIVRDLSIQICGIYENESVIFLHQHVPLRGWGDLCPY